MAPYYGRLRALFLSTLILILGIIHLGVGIGIVAKYRKYSVFQQQVGLSGFNIFIGLYTIILGIFAVVTSLTLNQLFRMIATVASFLMGILAIGSLIGALVISGQSVGYLRDTITDNIHDYATDSDSKDTVDLIQTDYDCCGVNLWLDWGSVQLDTLTGTGGYGRRRRHYLPASSSSLIRALRQGRQIVSSGTGVYNLPSSYSIELPVSCCSSGGTFIGNSLGGYCMVYASNSTSSFYLSGCLAPIANVALSQIVGIAVINTCLMILSFVCFIKLIMIIRHHADTNDQQPTDNKKSQELQQQPQPQQQYEQQYQQPSQPARFPIPQYQPLPPQQQYQEPLPQQQYQELPPQQQYQQPQYQAPLTAQQFPYGQYYTNNQDLHAFYKYKGPTHQTYL